MSRGIGNAPQQWMKPDPRTVKLNVDAAFHVDVGAGATGAVLRDDRGMFVAAQCLYVV